MTNPGFLVEVRTLDHINWVLDHKFQWQLPRRLRMLESCRTRLGQLLNQEKITRDEFGPVNARLLTEIAEAKRLCRQRGTATKKRATIAFGPIG